MPFKCTLKLQASHYIEVYYECNALCTDLLIVFDTVCLYRVCVRGLLLYSVQHLRKPTSATNQLAIALTTPR
jgi:hypothetical protein